MSRLTGLRGVRDHLLEKVAVQAESRGLKRESQKSWGGEESRRACRKTLSAGNGSQGARLAGQGQGQTLRRVLVLAGH